MLSPLNEVIGRLLASCRIYNMFSCFLIFWAKKKIFVLKTQTLNYYTGVREISAITVTDDYLCYKVPKSPYNFFHILTFNELCKFKTSDEWRH